MEDKKIGQCPTCGDCLTMDHQCGPLYNAKKQEKPMEELRESAMDANTEDYLEILYWEFDTEKKKGSFSERDLFKAKMRGLIRTIQNTRATDPLLEEMARALKQIDQWDWTVILAHSECEKEVYENLENVAKVLQKWEATCQQQKK